MKLGIVSDIISLEVKMLWQRGGCLYEQ